MNAEKASMHPNAMLIRRLYAALDSHDAAAIAECYDENAHFRDIAFDLRGRNDISAMWRMIASGDIRVTVDAVEADDAQGFARLVDEYTFRETRRRVRNPIESRFRFQDGRILEHVDRCDPRAWAIMALGPGMKSFIAGRLRLARAWKARSLLREFEREERLHGAPTPRT